MPDLGCQPQKRPLVTISTLNMLEFRLHQTQKSEAFIVDERLNRRGKKNIFVRLAKCYELAVALTVVVAVVTGAKPWSAFQVTLGRLLWPVWSGPAGK